MSDNVHEGATTALRAQLAAAEIDRASACRAVTELDAEAKS